MESKELTNMSSKVTSMKNEILKDITRNTYSEYGHLFEFSREELRHLNYLADGMINEIIKLENINKSKVKEKEREIREYNKLRKERQIQRAIEKENEIKTLKRIKEENDLLVKLEKENKILEETMEKLDIDSRYNLEKIKNNRFFSYSESYLDNCIWKVKEQIYLEIKEEEKSKYEIVLKNLLDIKVYFELEVIYRKLSFREKQLIKEIKFSNLVEFDSDSKIQSLEKNNLIYLEHENGINFVNLNERGNLLFENYFPDSLQFDKEFLDNLMGLLLLGGFGLCIFGCIVYLLFYI